jgi:hypothetical protein
VTSADDDTISNRSDGVIELFKRQVRIPVPEALRGTVAPVRRIVTGTLPGTTARILLVAIPAVLAAVGLAVALAGAALSVSGVEAVGTLGLEVGAAMWFAGAVTLGARPGPTVLRVVLLAATGLVGVALIAFAIVGGWTGVALDLAMEFGVGAVAVVVLDVVILGVIQTRLDQFSDARSPAAT